MNFRDLPTYEFAQYVEALEGYILAKADLAAKKAADIADGSYANFNAVRQAEERVGDTGHAAEKALRTYLQRTVIEP